MTCDGDQNAGDDEPERTLARCPRSRRERACQRLASPAIPPARSDDVGASPRCARHECQVNRAERPKPRLTDGQPSFLDCPTMTSLHDNPKLNITPRRRIGRNRWDFIQVALKTSDGRTVIISKIVEFDEVGTYMRQLIEAYPGARCIGQAAEIWGTFGEKDPHRPTEQVVVPMHLVQQIERALATPPEPEPDECQICYRKLDPDNHGVVDGYLLCMACTRRGRRGRRRRAEQGPPRPHHAADRYQSLPLAAQHVGGG